MKHSASKLVATSVALVFLACADSVGAAAEAAARLQPTSGNAASGDVSFTQEGDRVVVTADITGLPPNSVHGFHVHEKGDCSASDASSAGSHFNPLGKPHGHPTDTARHAGDLPNLEADGSGHARYRAETTLLSLSEGPAAVIGKAVIIHSNPDDYKSQPAGNAGGRIACGVVRRAER